MPDRAFISAGESRSSDALDQVSQLRAEVRAALEEVELGTYRYPVEANEQAARLERRAVEAGDEHLQLRALLVKADVQGRQGQSVACGRLLRSVNRWAIEHQDQYLLARSHKLLGLFFGALGDDVAYLENAMQSVELLPEDARPSLRADHLSSLGMSQGRLGATEEGRVSFAEAEELCRQVDDGPRLVTVVNNLAYLEHQAGEHERALVAVGRFLELAQEHRIALTPAHLDTIARVYLEVGRYEEAEDVLKGLLADDEAKASEADGEAEFLLTLAEVRRRGGALTEAEETLARCRAICEERSLHGVLVRVRQEQAELYAAQGRFQDAFSQFKVFYGDAQRLTSEARIARARTLQTVYDFEQARRTSQRFEEMAFHDPLTNLYNRRYVDNQLIMMLGRAAGPDDDISVAFIDLDHFKRINDTLSHAVGDQVLRQIAKLLTAAASEPGFVARMGGEEFLLVMPETNHEDAIRRCEELQDSIRSFDWQPLTQEVPVRASIGLVTASASDCDQTALLAEADRNVYEAKVTGRDRLVVTELIQDGVSAAG